MGGLIYLAAIIISVVVILFVFQELVHLLWGPTLLVVSGAVVFWFVFSSFRTMAPHLQSHNPDIALWIMTLVGAGVFVFWSIREIAQLRRLWRRWF